MEKKGRISDKMKRKEEERGREENGWHKGNRKRAENERKVTEKK